ncbi:SDR family NAD(P)-dependent oxidoreductase [Butyrivibrio sp. XBB1001]|uniref:SDR family NAD(P)-dependent oxidoreductase n=1 Tax=Butyrivibrio sp. XBB1001 TaxID=1280682 RepID=UPI0004091815|nr:SDR family NAD(P)-dependent oxidoreductase [Butyrivibrio sp. XBB1001]
MVAIVTGASSGFGYEVCKQLVEKGYKVYGISRRNHAPTGVTTFCADVSDGNSVRLIVDDIALKEGRIDLLIANAGMGISGPVELTSEKMARRIMDVNFFGQIHIVQAVLPYMRAQKGGTIVFVSSVGASIALPFQAFYSATKSAVNSVALALRNEVRKYGICVTVVMPGDASTGFTDARIKHNDCDIETTDSAALYPGYGNAIASIEKDERNGVSPEQVANVIVCAACKKNPAPLYVVGIKYRFFISLYNILPKRIAIWLVGKYYL